MQITHKKRQKTTPLFSVGGQRKGGEGADKNLIQITVDL